mgnify:CR=1 FL=1
MCIFQVRTLCLNTVVFDLVCSDYVVGHVMNKIIGTDANSTYQDNQNNVWKCRFEMHFE